MRILDRNMAFDARSALDIEAAASSRSSETLRLDVNDAIITLQNKIRLLEVDKKIQAESSSEYNQYLAAELAARDKSVAELCVFLKEE